MLDVLRSSTTKLAPTLIVAATLFFALAPAAKAADGSDEATGTETRPRRVTTAPQEKTGSEQEPIKVAYVLYERSLIAEAEPEKSPSTPSSITIDWSASTPTAPLPGAPPQNSSSVISTAPMTAGEKFSYWIHKSFLSPGAYGTALFNGLYKELLDNDDFKEDTTENYFADSMTRAARSFAFSANAGFFEKAVFPTIFRQDPRYHRSGKKGAGARIGYALTRVLVTQGDRCGCHQVNASFLLGAAAATGMSNLWERRERTGPMHNLSRFYTHVYLTALFNVVKEFVSGQ
jgi:hypothetical protein